MKRIVLGLMLATTSALATPVSFGWYESLIRFTPALQNVTHVEVPEWANYPQLVSFTDLQLGIAEYAEGSFMLSIRAVVHGEPIRFVWWIDLTPLQVGSAAATGGETPEPSYVATLAAAFVVMFLRINRGKRRSEWRKVPWNWNY